MPKSKKIDLISIFATTPDPRIDRQKKHQPIDIIIITICAIISGADTWVEIEAVAKAKKSWFKSFLKLPTWMLSFAKMTSASVKDLALKILRLFVNLFDPD